MFPYKRKHVRRELLLCENFVQNEPSEGGLEFIVNVLLKKTICMRPVKGQEWAFECIPSSD